MSVVRNDTGEVRLAWRLTLAILLYVAVAVLLRLIPIGLYTASLVRSGMTRGSALERANTIILQDPVCSTAIGILSALVGFLIVWFLVVVIERSSFTWKTVGLDWRGNSLPAILLGTILALLLFIASALTGYVSGLSGSSLNTPMMGVTIPIFIEKLVLYLGMGFGEEVVFRGYLQTRLVKRYRAIWGVLAAAVIFTLLHQISYRLSPVTIVSGVMLWTTVGALYLLSKSLYLVGMFHGVMNTLLNTPHFEVDDISSMVVHAFALFLVIVVFIVRPRVSGSRSDPA
jgi:membrane protease YdiL (CAAX protease family)